MILVGLLAMSAQIIFMREFLVVFQGNEISIGIILANWLIWGAFGSLVLGRFSDSIKAKIPVFAACQILLSVILPVVIFLIRCSRGFIGTAAGEIIGYVPMVLISFVLVSLPCAVMAFMFSLACSIYHEAAPQTASAAARMYTVEAVGALAGGFAASIFMLWHIPVYYLIFSLSFLTVLAALSNMSAAGGCRGTKFILPVGVSLVMVFCWMLFSGTIGYIDKKSKKFLWTGFDVVASGDSIYGNVTLTKQGDQLSFYENGLHLYTVPDPLYAEESVHYAMLESVEPQEVLLIGGGIGGQLSEILKYSVKSIDYVELDPMLIDMAKDLLNEKDRSVLSDKRVNIIHQDGRFYIKNTKKKYDVVIISLGDPYTAQLDRFYSTGFFRELREKLKKGAVVSFALTSSENYVSGEMRDYFQSIYLSLRECFPERLIIPGDTAYFLASNEQGALT
ncbi:MAG: fused MFS/spermidine synthase, partial [Candidatus Omnitrophica bacterium]|nr:fused MFS/spermidine synthase [Candidatus Omnitrophota bacterium]